MNTMSHIYKEYNKKIGNTVFKMRKKRNISQEQLSELANIHRTYLSDVEGGKRNLTVTVLKRIVDSLDLDMSSFFKMVEQEGEIYNDE
ncbi:helix-turn-helix domain-containing protein [Staphylococcus saprophyticus]|uniref:helix-turn-helix domain-containing protein n=1 Tax=Staphylococcus saprophyticus TaxID=29385 RepID=UPI003BF4EE21